LVHGFVSLVLMLMLMLIALAPPLANCSNNSPPIVSPSVQPAQRPSGRRRAPAPDPFDRFADLFGRADSRGEDLARIGGRRGAGGAVCERHADATGHR
jgi:hypothetical protein